MTILNPSAFLLASLAGLVVLFHFLRARERSREVSALFLWEDLRGEPQSRAAQLRQRIDILLLLQLLALFAIVVALARPVLPVTVARLSDLVIVIDGSASMQTTVADRSTRYDEAVASAVSILDQYPSTATTVIQLSAQPRVLASPATPQLTARQALQASAPTTLADGTAGGLTAALSGLPGWSSAERIILFTDHALPDAPAGVETRLIGGGENRAITAFTVRENVGSPGATAFVAIDNMTDDYQDVRIRISDGVNQTSLSVLLVPNGVEEYIVPFPSSRGTQFTAHLDPADDLPIDDVRYFALERALDLRVHWVGPENRYLLAALESAAPVVLVEGGEPADLTVAYDDELPFETEGNILLVHSRMPGYVLLGPDPEPPAAGEALAAVTALDDSATLLTGIDAGSFRVRVLPEPRFDELGLDLLAVGDTPLLTVWQESDRLIAFLAPDLMETNLPIVVDFPLLVRNLVGTLIRIPAEATYRWTHTGEPVHLSVGGRRAVEVLDPFGRSIEVSDGVETFRPEHPGHYTLVTDRERFPVAVNIPPGESAPPAEEPPATETRQVEHAAMTLLPLWPYAAALAVLLLLIEALFYGETRWPIRRKNR